MIECDHCKIYCAFWEKKVEKEIRISQLTIHRLDELDDLRKFDLLKFTFFQSSQGQSTNVVILSNMYSYRPKMTYINQISSGKRKTRP